MGQVCNANDNPLYLRLVLNVKDVKHTIAGILTRWYAQMLITKEDGSPERDEGASIELRFWLQVAAASYSK